MGFEILHYSKLFLDAKGIFLHRSIFICTQEKLFHFSSNPSKNFVTKIVISNIFFLCQVRYGGQTTQLPITVPIFYNRKGIDIYLFWGAIWITPMLLYTWYHALKYGDAKIAPIPEDYQPKEWEYERNMITR